VSFSSKQHSCWSSANANTAEVTGETNDEETGLAHLGHAACNIMFLLRYEADNRTDLDDRDKVVMPTDTGN
jgi:hypothetical protein